MKNKNTTTAILLCALLFSSFTSFTQVYVAPEPTGSDMTGDGSPSSPYATIQKGIDKTPPEGTVYIGSGIYNLTTGIKIERGDKGIVLKKNGPGEVIINAENLEFSDGVPYIIVVVNTQNVTIDSLTLQNGRYDIAKGVWILENPASSIANKNIIVKNCIFRNIGWISNNLTTRPSNSSVAASAIRVDGQNSIPMDSILLLNNNISNCATGWGEAVTITGNVNSFRIEGNIIHDIANIGIVAAGNYSYTTAPTLLNQARNGIIRGNTIYNCMSGRATSAGIYLDGSLNCVVEKNEVYQNGAGISLGAEIPIPAGVTVGGHQIYNNLIYQNAIAGMYIGADTPGNYVKNSRIINNTFYKNVTGAHINGVALIGKTDTELQSVDDVANGSNGDILLLKSDATSFYNNIIYPSATRHALVGLSGDTTTNFSSGYNLYYQDDSSPLFYFANPHPFNNIINQGSYGSITEFNQTTTQESNSIFGNPNFMNPSTYQFELANNQSAAFNIGNSSYFSGMIGATDFAGNQRIKCEIIDAGAYEFQDCSSMPVTFLESYYKVFKVQNKVLLQWATATESNSNLFEIERSSTGLEFVKIGEVKARGTSSNVQTYSYTDNEPKIGLSYYRLKQWDNDGKFVYTSVKEVVFEDKTRSIIVYPNPVKNNNLTIDLGKEITKPVFYSIIDVQGKIISSNWITNKIQKIYLNNMVSGSYFIRLNDGSKIKFIKK